MITTFRIMLAAALLLPVAAMAQTSTYRDGQGRVVGTSSTDSTGTTTTRDAQGRVTGTERTDSTGTTTIRDAQGRVVGTRR